MLWCPTDHLSPPPPPPPPPLLYCDNDALLPLPSQQQQQQQRKRRRSEDSAADRLSPPPPHFKRPLHPASATEVGGRPIHQAPRLSVLRVSGDGRSAPLLPLPWDQPKRSRISGSGRRRVAASSHGLPPPPPPPPALHWVISPISAADSGLAASTMDFSPVTTTVTTAGPSAALSPRHSRHHRRPPRRLSYTLRTRPGSPLPDDEDVTEEVTMAQSMLDASGTIMADGVVQYGPLAMMPATPARGPSSPPTVPVVSERTRRDSIARALRSPGLSPAVREILTGGGSSVVHTKQVDARPTRRGQKSDEYAMAAADVSVDLDAMVGDGAVEDLRHATLDLGILLFEGE
ncbi:hypothetical protein BC828DRAFT_376609 [Blastocladiella britannica]|nr:hypothetical protein BC828DRAFT_376609 [Blastocladiella britannica]